jgi:hypothetical protein
VSELIAVEARFDVDGAVQPLAFIWKDQRYAVSSVGRSSQQGEALHFLVMTPTDQVFELAYSPAASSWRLVRHPGQFGGPRSKPRV